MFPGAGIKKRVPGQAKPVRSTEDETNRSERTPLLSESMEDDFCDLSTDAMNRFTISVRADVHANNEPATLYADDPNSRYNIQRASLSGSMNNYMKFEPSVVSALDPAAEGSDDARSRANSSVSATSLGSDTGLKLSHDDTTR